MAATSAGAPPGRWRTIGDPETKRVIETIYGAEETAEHGDHPAHGDIDAVLRLLDDLVVSSSPNPETLPEPARRCIAAPLTLPEEATRELIAEGQSVFSRYGLLAYVVLGCASLPQCYVIPSIANVLVESNRLVDDVHIRILETSAFVLAVMEPGELLADGPGVRAARRIRLMHAAMRFIVEHDHDIECAEGHHPLSEALLRRQWDRNRFGEPINQEDLVLTLMTFSKVILNGWEVLGVELEEREKLAYLHCWNVVGLLMGIDERLLPATLEEAQAILDRLNAEQAAETDQGAELAESLLNAIARLLPLMLRFAPPSLVRELFGDRLADLLRVKESGFVRAPVMAIVDFLVRPWNRARRVFYAASPRLRLDREYFSRRILLRLSELPDVRGRTIFELPSRWRERWRL